MASEGESACALVTWENTKHIIFKLQGALCTYHRHSMPGSVVVLDRKQPILLHTNLTDILETVAEKVMDDTVSNIV